MGLSLSHDGEGVKLAGYTLQNASLSLVDGVVTASVTGPGWGRAATTVSGGTRFDLEMRSSSTAIGGLPPKLPAWIFRRGCHRSQGSPVTQQPACRCRFLSSACRRPPTSKRSGRKEELPCAARRTMERSTWPRSRSISSVCRATPPARSAPKGR